MKSNFSPSSRIFRRIPFRSSSNGTIRSFHPGKRSETASQRGRKGSQELRIEFPSRIVFVSASAAFRTFSRALRESASIASHDLKKSSPASVSSTPVLKRRKSSAPIPFSSLSIRFITAVGVIKSASAAFVKLPARDTVRNVSTSGLRIGNMIETEYFLRILE